MTTDGLNSDREPLPRYAIPNGSGPEYEAIPEQIQYQRKSMIGSALYPGRSGRRVLPVQDHPRRREDFFS
jgi:hypothetical protein